MTIEQAKQLHYRQIIYYRWSRNADGSLCRWYVNGRVKTWKKTPDKVEVPIKHGLYSYAYLNNNNLADFDLVDNT